MKAKINGEEAGVSVQKIQRNRKVPCIWATQSCMKIYVSNVSDWSPSYRCPINRFATSACSVTKPEYTLSLPNKPEPQFPRKHTEIRRDEQSGYNCYAFLFIGISRGGGRERHCAISRSADRSGANPSAPPSVRFFSHFSEHGVALGRFAKRPLP